MDDYVEDEEEAKSRMYDMSQYSPDKVVSVADRSMMSQNFVHGTEESEESILGVAKKVIVKPLPYGEFKSAVRRTASSSTAPTHEQFMWEVSETWKSLLYSNFKSIGLNSFKKAQAENKLTLYHELQDDEYFRDNP